LGIFKKVVSALIVQSTVLSLLSGCVFDQREQVVISVGNMFYDSLEVEADINAIWAKEKEIIRRFEKKYPYIKVIPSTYQYTEDTFVALSAAKQLPTFFRTWFTEVQKISRAGLAVDLTDVYVKNGYDKDLSEQVRQVVAPDGRYYAFPADIYSKGIQVNLKLLEAAGFMKEGVPVIPGTWEELVEMAVVIKEKTGAKGFAIQSGETYPAWDFMNIAWSYGVKFMEQLPDGSYQATFDSPEMKQAMHLLYDMRWKYDILLEKELCKEKKTIDHEFLNDRLAFAFSQDNIFDYIRTIDRDCDYIAKAHSPAGAAGGKELLGGGVYMISSAATPEQIDACVKWAQFNGYTSDANEDAVESWHGLFRSYRELNYTVGIKDPQIWKNTEWNQKYEQVREQYINIDVENFAGYNDFSTVDLVLEEPLYCQELYRILTIGINEVLESPRCNIDAIIKKANNDFQNYYLNLTR